MIELTDYGFKWGNMTLSRMFGDEVGDRYLSVETPKGEYHIRITPSGFVMGNKSDSPNIVNVTTKLVKARRSCR